MTTREMEACEKIMALIKNSEAGLDKSQLAMATALDMIWANRGAIEELRKENMVLQSKLADAQGAIAELLKSAEIIANKFEALHTDLEDVHYKVTLQGRDIAKAKLGGDY